MNAGLFVLVVLLFLGAEAFKVSSPGPEVIDAKSKSWGTLLDRESKCMEEMLKVRATEKLVQGGKQPGVG